MVRAGVVCHPSEWDMNGYNEIQKPPIRYGVIDHQELQRLCGIPDPERFKEEYRQWITVALTGGSMERESSWTESVAVGNRNFIEEVKVRLGIKAVCGTVSGVCRLFPARITVSGILAPVRRFEFSFCDLNSRFSVSNAASGSWQLFSRREFSSQEFSRRFVGLNFRFAI